MSKKRVTIADVAQKAKVSTGTVSAVINDRPSVRDQTRQHVLSTIESMGYEPSPAARNLGGSRGDREILERGVGLIVKEMDNPFYMEVVVGAQELLEDRGFIAFTSTSEGSYEKEGELIRAFRNRFVNGVIIAPFLGDQVDLSHLFMLRRAGYPFVLLESVPGLQAHAVSVDNVQASRAAVSHLIELGHERIVHFSGPPYTQHTRDRIAGTEKAFSQSHLRFSEDVVIPTGAHLEDGYRAALEYFGKGEHAPTAATCFNDLVAIGVMRALAELGLDVPGDVSIVGFDDIPSAAFLSTPLTTMKVPKKKMGRRAAQLLLAILEANEELPPEHAVLEADLVVRGSTQPQAASD